jgi:hypothetical protein
MKKNFFEYYKPSDKDFEVLWKDCLFVFDTCVLLNLYEFSPKVRDEFLENLKKISGRIWIPHQVAKEYQSRRPFVIREQRELHQLLQNKFLALRDTLIQDIEKIDYHPFIDKKNLSEEIGKKFSDLLDYLKKCEDDYPNLITKDLVGEKIDSLFDGKVGLECKEEELTRLFALGAKRYQLKIPPGFADQQSKDNFKRYGDLILWFQIIRHANKSKKPVIFVTSEQKNDWWVIYHKDQKYKKEILSPRPELIREFFEKTHNLFYMYNFSDFGKASRKFLKQKVSEVAIKEAQNISQRQDERFQGYQELMCISSEPWKAIEALKESQIGVISRAVEDYARISAYSGPLQSGELIAGSVRGPETGLASWKGIETGLGSLRGPETGLGSLRGPETGLASWKGIETGLASWKGIETGLGSWKGIETGIELGKGSPSIFEDISIPPVITNNIKKDDEKKSPKRKK